MKANELMIGDWVNTSDGISRVIYIAKYSGIYTDNTNIGEKLYSLHEINPIPLTPEILEKNGFEKQDYQWKYRDNSCMVIICIAPLIEIDGEMIDDNLANVMLHGALFDIDITFDGYVHELQHALKLCGIEKEIEL